MSTKASLFVVYLLLHFMTVQTAEDTSSHHDASQHVHHKHHTADAQHSSPPMKTSPTTGHMNHHHNQHAGNDHIPTEEDPTMAGGKHAHEQGDHVNNNQQHQQSHGSGHSVTQNPTSSQFYPIIKYCFRTDDDVLSPIERHSVVLRRVEPQFRWR